LTLLDVVFLVCYSKRSSFLSANSWQPLLAAVPRIGRNTEVVYCNRCSFSVILKASDMNKDQEFVEYVVKALVDHPGDVRVERNVDEMGVLLTLHLNPEDMGKIIGRSGQTAKALRTLLRVVGAKERARVNLKIVEPEGSTRGPRAPQPEAEATASDLDDFKL